MGIWLFVGTLVLIILVTLFILVLVSTVKIRLHLVFRNKDFMMSVGIRILYGLVNMHTEVPLKVSETGVNFGDRPPSTESSKDRVDGAEEKVKNKKAFRYNDYKLLIQATEGLKKWFLDTLSIVRLNEVHWATSFALDNAADTGVAGGMVWGIKHTLMGLLSFYLQLTSAPQLQVLPAFNGPPQLMTNFSCVIRFNFGRALFAGLMLMVRILSVRGGLKIWRNVLFKNVINREE